MSLSDAETQGKLVWLTESYYQTYRAAINQSPYVSKEIESANTTITYTAMHGVGAKWLRIYFMILVSIRCSA